MTFPLNKDEISFVENLLNRIENDKIVFSFYEYQVYFDIIQEMINRNVLFDSTSAADVDCKQFIITSDVQAFSKYVLNENEKAKEMTKREWKIAIVAALIGALASLLSVIICG